MYWKKKNQRISAPRLEELCGKRAMSTSKTLYNNLSVQVEHDGENNILSIHWKKRITFEAVEKQRNHILKIIKSNECSRLLFDCREFGPIPPNEQKQLLANWQPSFQRANIEKIATILPSTPIAEATVENLCQKARETDPSTLQNTVFTAVAEALEWLEVGKS